VEWLRCTTLQELLQAKARLPGARLVAGNTEVGIEMHIKGARPSALLDPTAVPELQELREGDSGLLVSLCSGQSITRGECMRAIRHRDLCRLAAP